MSLFHVGCILEILLLSIFIFAVFYRACDLNFYFLCSFVVMIDNLLFVIGFMHLYMLAHSH